MPKEPKEPRPPLVIQPFADGEASVLGAFARIEADILESHGGEPYWAGRISQLRARLSTPVAQKIAAYLLGEEICNDDDPAAEKAAWDYAQDMMIQARPGFRERLSIKLGAGMSNTK